MNPLRALFHPKRDSWAGCRPLSAVERMQLHNPRVADAMRERENAGAAAPRTRMVNGRPVLIAFRITTPAPLSNTSAELPRKDLK